MPIRRIPTANYLLMPEVEDLSMRLARAAGVNACETSLVKLSRLQARHGYDLTGLTDVQGRPLVEKEACFLAVPRYDRIPGGRIHCEDFAQVFEVMPKDKYKRYAYADVARVMLNTPSLGESAVHELLRRVLVNEMLGNYDMHLKNMGLYYPDGRTPELPPAYDIVAHAVYLGGRGAALPLWNKEDAQSLGDIGRRVLERATQVRSALTPAGVRAFCELLDIPEKPARTALAACVKNAVEHWPAMIANSAITPLQKGKLMAHFQTHPAVGALVKKHLASCH